MTKTNATSGKSVGELLVAYRKYCEKHNTQELSSLDAKTTNIVDSVILSVMKWMLSPQEEEA